MKRPRIHKSFNGAEPNIIYLFTKNPKIGKGTLILLNNDYYNLNSQWGASEENFT